ncbi:MAG: ABC transporter ATP-binding protein [Pedosphaera sp.]|nr:ABC transporter ATP-binding protein [Pedosphaera sp.]
MAPVSIQNVSKTFHPSKGVEIHALRNVSFDARPGELLVIVGPSGSGKSTLLRLIAGLERPTSGAISIDSRDMSDVDPKDRDVAMVFQNHALYPHMTAYDNLAFPLKLRKVPHLEIDRAVRATAELLGISSHLDRLPADLSGGERQRVAVGRAIIRQPKVFLLDEPLSNLDAPLRTQLRGELLTLHRRLGTTMIYVTHDQVEAMTLGHRIAVLHQGELQQIGEPLDLYHHPVNTFVAGFIGTPAINLIPGRIVPDGARWLFVSESADQPALRLFLPGVPDTALRHQVETPLLMGLRPEHIEVHPLSDGCQQHFDFEAVVDRIETLGHETHLQLMAQSLCLTARVAPDMQITRGATVHVALRMDRAHFFEPVSGKALR